MEQAPALLEMLMKGGASGILIVIICVLAAEVVRLRKQQVRTFAERDAYRVAYAVYRQAAKNANLNVDESALRELPIALPAT